MRVFCILHTQNGADRKTDTRFEFPDPENLYAQDISLTDWGNTGSAYLVRVFYISSPTVTYSNPNFFSDSNEFLIDPKGHFKTNPMSIRHLSDEL